MNRPDNLPVLSFKEFPPRFTNETSFLGLTMDEVHIKRMQMEYEAALDNIAKHISEAKDNYILKGLSIEQLTKLQSMCDGEIERRKNES